MIGLIRTPLLIIFQCCNLGRLRIYIKVLRGNRLGGDCDAICMAI